MNSIELIDLFPFLTRDCPLNDHGYAAILSRIIISYLGKEEITLTAVSYTSNSLDIRGVIPQKNSMFRYKTCCISTNGSFYLIEDKMFHWSANLYFQYYKNNLRYIGSQEINTIPSPIHSNKNGDDNIINRVTNKHREKIFKYQKYIKTMRNKQWEEIPPLNDDWNYYYDDDDDDDDYFGLFGARKQIEIDNICVVDLNFDDEKYINTDNDDDYLDQKVDKKLEGSDNIDDDKSDFCWQSPMRQIDNTAMVFVLNNNKTNIFIKYHGIEKRFDMNDYLCLHTKVLDVWQCNKTVYSIIKVKVSSNQTQLQLIKIYFVKREDTNSNGKIKNNSKINSNSNVNRKMSKKSNTKTKTKTESKGKTKFKAKAMKCDCKPMQQVVLTLVALNSSLNHNVSKNKRKVGSPNAGLHKMSTLPNICKNCNYFDSKSQTLFTVENIASNKNKNKNKNKNRKNKKNRKDKTYRQGIILRLISKQQTVDTNIKRNKHQSKLSLKESKTKSVQSISPKISNNNINHKTHSSYKNKNKKSKFNDIEMKQNEIIVNEIKTQSIFLNLLFNQSKCHFVFYHKQSKTLILMLKLVVVNISDTYHDQHDDEYKENIINEIKSNLIDNDHDNAQGYLKWKQNAMMNNNGRLLVQLTINFKKKKLISSRIGNIVINENKCRIVAYDQTRAMIVYDTLPDIIAQYQPLRDLHQIQCGKIKVEPDFEAECCQYQDIRLFLPAEHPNSNIHGHRSQSEAKIHNYKMMRLNDLVDRWIDLPIL